MVLYRSFFKIFPHSNEDFAPPKIAPHCFKGCQQLHNWDWLKKLNILIHTFNMAKDVAPMT